MPIAVIVVYQGNRRPCSTIAFHFHHHFHHHHHHHQAIRAIYHFRKLDNVRFTIAIVCLPFPIVQTHAALIQEHSPQSPAQLIPNFSTMAFTVLATTACPPTREVHCSCNSSAAPHSPISGGVASAPSSRRRDIPGPGAPRQSTAIVSSRHLSDSDIRALPASVVAQRVCAPLRKKLGEPLKSSLKLRRAHPRGPLSVIADSVDSSSSKCASATLAHKGVRFHSELEHVKFFLAKQKPLAVSRDGIPTDTSGTDSEFIYDGGGGDDLKERPLVMYRIDVPTAPPLPDDTRDVVVENIDFVGTVVKGTVRVRNIAFGKWIAVRFTLDKWQTTSEVTARYKESIQNGTLDRFMFSIKLAGVLSRAEEKTLYLSVRYSVAGREIWDNNSGRNYQVRFVRANALKGNMEARAAVVEGREESPRADDIADLRRKLGELVELGCPSKTVGSILAQESRLRCESPSPGSPAPSPPSRETTPSFKSEEFPAASRYDFAASSRTPWCPPAVHQTISPARTLSPRRARARSCSDPFRPCTSPVVHPTTAAAVVSSLFLDCSDSDSDDLITPVSSLPNGGEGCGSNAGSRNHTRGGSIALSHAPGVKLTPLTSLFACHALSACPLSAPTAALSPRQPQPHACSDSSTPSITSGSLSRSPSTSPCFSPAEPDTDRERDSTIHHFNYHNIVDRYDALGDPGDVFGR